MDLKSFDNLESFAKRELNLLKGKTYGLNLYIAGKDRAKKKGFNFYARDLILSSILLEDMRLLRDSLILCSILQGKRNNPYNAEEEGKIFHEYPERKRTEKEGLNTGFNNCDNTALFIIGLDFYFLKTKDSEFLKKIRGSFFLALKYLKKHIKENIFWENPAFSGAKKFRLKTTYWKDTGILGRENYEPIYPVAYTLVQAQVIKALDSANNILKVFGNKNLPILKIRKKMIKKLWNSFWDSSSKNLFVGIDRMGPIKSNSSDFLHMLYYLEKREVPKRKLRFLLNKSSELKTKYGYRGALDSRGIDSYYSAIWPWEQAFIFLAGIKHGLPELKEISFNLLDAIEKLNCFPEVVGYFDGTLKRMNYNTQLWTISAVLSLLKHKEFLN